MEWKAEGYAVWDSEVSFPRIWETSWLRFSEMQLLSKSAMCRPLILRTKGISEDWSGYWIVVGTSVTRPAGVRSSLCRLVEVSQSKPRVNSGIRSERMSRKMFKTTFLVILPFSPASKSFVAKAMANAVFEMFALTNGNTLRCQ